MRLIIIIGFIFFLLSCRTQQEVITEQYSFIDHVFKIKYGEGEYTVYAISDDIIRVNYNDINTSGNNVYAPIQFDTSFLRFQKQDDLISLSTKTCKVEVLLNPVTLSFYDIQSGLKLKESNGYNKNGDTTKFNFILGQNEKIFGTGMRSIPINRRGFRFDHYNQPQYGYEMDALSLNYSIPHYLSNYKYMVLIDDPAKGYFDVGKTNESQLEFGSLNGNTSYYFINGDSYRELMFNYVELTGHQDLPPLWAFGNLQSRFGYKSQDEVEKTVQTTLDSDYPVDAVIIDLYWFSQEIQDGRMGNLSWDKENWPDPKAMISKLKEKNIQTITVSEPFFINTSSNFNYLSDNQLLGFNKNNESYIIDDFYFGDAGLIDLFNPKAKDWMWNFYKSQKEMGIAGFWGDLGEPEKHPDDMLHAKGPATSLHGLYGNEWVKLIYEGYKKEYPNERMFKLGRSGFAGSQRYSLIPWSGDVSRSWEGYKAQLPILLSMGLSGLGYMHSDAGGFSMADVDTMLYVRWMQFATFTPIFRPHGDAGVAPSEPALWPEDIQALIKPFIELRYQLLPYIYSTAFENKRTGVPIMRPMFFEFEDDPNCYDLQYQYMLGNNFLIAPVLEKEVNAVDIYLPKGVWYSYITSEKFKGDQMLEYKVDDATIPVLVKGGSLIPTVNISGNTSTYKTDSLHLTYFMPDKNQVDKSEIYFDDGQTKNAFEKGNFELLEFQSNYKKHSLIFEFTTTGKGYRGSPGSRNIRFTIIGLTEFPQNFNFDGKEIDFESSEPGDLHFDVEIMSKGKIEISF